MRKTGGRGSSESALLPPSVRPSTESHTCLSMSAPRGTLHRRMAFHGFHTPYYCYSLRIPREQKPGDPGGDA
jgi:hypothetical protein